MLPSLIRSPAPDRISLVTVLVTRNVIRMARNIHIIGRSDGPPAPTVSFTPESSEGTGPAASTRTASSPVHRLMPGVYAPRRPGPIAPLMACPRLRAGHPLPGQFTPGG